MPVAPVAVPAEVPAAPLPQIWNGDDRVNNAAESNCVSIMAGTSDWWCATTCASRQDEASCPPTMCKCDASAKADADERAAAALASHKEAEDAIKAAAAANAFVPAAVPAVSPAAVPAQQVQAVAPAQAQPDAPLMSHEEAEAQVKAAADAVKAAADEVKASMMPGASPGAEPAKRCTAILETASDEWCAMTCATSYCPPTACKCDEEEAAPLMQLDTLPASPAPDGPGVDWATGQPLPQAPTAVPEAAYEMPVDPAVPQVAAVPETPVTPVAPVAVPAPPVPETPATPAAPVAVPAPLPAVPVDDRINNAAESNCVSIMAGTSDWWCATTCASRPDEASACPPTMCKCDDAAKADADQRAADALAAQKAAEDIVKAAAAVSAAMPAVSPAAVVPAQVQTPASSQEQDAAAATHKAAEDAVKAAANAMAQPAASPAASPKPAGKNCKAILETASDEWCETTCATSYCPPTACKCDE